MGKIIKYLTISILIFLFIYLIRSALYVLHDDHERIMLKIINVDSDFSIKHWFTLLDNSDIKNFSFKEVEKNNDFQLIFIEDAKYINFPQCYYYFKTIAKEGFLKAPPFYRMLKNRKIPSDNYMDYIVDIEIFNLYVKEKKMSKVDTIVSTYIGILNDKNTSERNATDLYREIFSIDDLVQLLADRPSYPSPFNNLIDIDSINIDTHNGRYYWFYDEGLVKVNFLFEETGLLKSVHFTRIGRLGNENLGI